MHIFVTGASGWIGSHTVDELLAHGHELTGLVRSDAAEASVRAKGATVLRGDLDDLDSLRRGTEGADAVVHLANKHDFANPGVSDRAERAAVETLLAALEGSDRVFALASGTAIRPGTVVTEDVPSTAVGPDSMRGGTEQLAMEFAERGVRPIALRFAPTTHGTGDHGFMAAIFSAASRLGAAMYPVDGANRWSAVHVTDAARMIRLGLEAAPASARLHAVGEEGVTTKAIAEAVGARLGIPTRSADPEEVVAELGFIGRILTLDLPASSAQTRELLGWTPTGPTLLADIEAGAYDGVTAG